MDCGYSLPAHIYLIISIYLLPPPSLPPFPLTSLVVGKGQEPSRGSISTNKPARPDADVGGICKKIGSPSPTADSSGLWNGPTDMIVVIIIMIGSMIQLGGGVVTGALDSFTIFGLVTDRRKSIGVRRDWREGYGSGWI